MREDPPRPTPVRRRRRRPRRRIGVVTWAILAFAFFAVAGCLSVNFYSRLTGQSAGSILKNLTHKPFDGKPDVNILVLGVDDKVELGRSDTMILAHINLDTKEIRGLSIPRDSRVRIPGRQGYEKINAAFSHGKAALSKQVVEQTLGVPINGYLKTNVGGFKGLVDALGGVDLFVEKNMRYNDHAQNLHIRLDKGQQHLDGERAMEYVRFRHDALGDITRMQRQQKFLKAVVTKLMEPSSWPRIPGIVLRSREFVETDLPPNDLTALARMARDLKGERIRMETVPGVPQTIGGVSYFIIDEPRKAQLVQSLFFAPSAPEVVLDPSVPRPQVEVLNGSGTSGLAGVASKQLRNKGYKVIGTGNADHFGYASSRIIASAELTQGAQQIAAVLGCGSVEVSQNAKANTPVTIILGKDYQPISN